MYYESNISFYPTKLCLVAKHTVIISSKEAQYLSLISDYSAYQTMPESGFAATVYLCQHELGVGQINVCREAFLKKCAGEEKCPIQPQHYYPPYLLGKNFLSGVFPNFHVKIHQFCSILTKISHFTFSSAIFCFTQK